MLPNRWVTLLDITGVCRSPYLTTNGGGDQAGGRRAQRRRYRHSSHDRQPPPPAEHRPGPPHPPRQLYFLKQEANSPTGVARAQWMSQVNTSLEASDPEIFEIVEREKTRQVRACGDPTPPLGLTRQGQASGARVRADDRPAADPVGGEHLATLCHPALCTARRRP